MRSRRAFLPEQSMQQLVRSKHIKLLRWPFLLVTCLWVNGDLYLYRKHINLTNGGVLYSHPVLKCFCLFFPLLDQALCLFRTLKQSIKPYFPYFCHDLKCAARHGISLLFYSVIILFWMHNALIFLSYPSNWQQWVLDKSLITVELHKQRTMSRTFPFGSFRIISIWDSNSHVHAAIYSRTEPSFPTNRATFCRCRLVREISICNIFLKPKNIIIKFTRSGFLSQPHREYKRIVFIWLRRRLKNSAAADAENGGKKAYCVHTLSAIVWGKLVLPRFRLQDVLTLVKVKLLQI